MACFIVKAVILSHNHLLHIIICFTNQQSVMTPVPAMTPERWMRRYKIWFLVIELITIIHNYHLIYNFKSVCLICVSTLVTLHPEW